MGTRHSRNDPLKLKEHLAGVRGFQAEVSPQAVTRLLLHTKLVRQCCSHFACLRAFVSALLMLCVWHTDVFTFELLQCSSNGCTFVHARLGSEVG